MRESHDKVEGVRGGRSAVPVRRVMDNVDVVKLSDGSTAPLSHRWSQERPRQWARSLATAGA